MSVDPRERAAFKALLDKAANEDEQLLRPAGALEAVEVEAFHRLLDLESEFEILEWRFEQLRAAGYDEAAASQLAACADIDLHLARRLLEQGCDPMVALRILC